MIKFKVYLILLITLLITYHLSLITAFSDNHNATTCSQADVQAAITAASDGDTVLVPNGSATWSSQVTINKAITVKGNGVYSINPADPPTTPDTDSWMDTGTWPLVITLSNNNGFYINLTSVSPARVTGFKFIGTTPTDNNGAINVAANGMSNAYRIDNCYFGVTSRSIYIFTGKGLIDHCYMYDPGSCCNMNISIEETKNTGDGGWALMQPINFGGPDFVFIEDNTFYRPTIPTSAAAAATDLVNGGKMVVRNCHIRNCGIMCHGDDTGGQNMRGTYAHEVYNNKCYGSVPGGISMFLSERGGSWLCNGNTYFNKGAGYNPGVHYFWIRRLVKGYTYYWGFCDDVPTHPWDGNTGGNSPAGHRCLGQSGTGRSTQLTPDTPGFTQEHQVSYIWNETRVRLDSGPLNYISANPSNYFTIENHTASSPWPDATSYDVRISTDSSVYNDFMKGPASRLSNEINYVPYPYPHPLQGGGDTTPPATIATVNDGTGADISYTLSTTQLQANWTASTDPESGISGYKYAIGTAAGASNITNWTTLGNVLTVTKTGLTLTVGTTYYFSVKAVNTMSLEGTPTNSNGQFVKGDTTPPGPPAAVRDGSGADISFTLLNTQLSANWDAAFDPESNIAKYYYAIGTTAGATNLVGWTDNGTGLSVARTGLTLTVGTTYYFSVKAQNGVGLQGTARNSDGQVLLTVNDTTPPTNIAAVNDGTGSDIDTTFSLTQLSANWTASSDPESNISGYKYAIGTTAGGINTVNWTLLGNVLTITKTGLTLTVGATYYFSVKAVNGIGLESASAKNSDGICVTAQGSGLLVTGVDITNLTDRSATVVWNTDLDTRGQVQYGTTLNYIGGGEESALSKRHMIDIKSLAPDTRYHYRVLNIDGDGNTTQSDDYNFKTFVQTNPGIPIVGKVYPNPYKLSDTGQITFALNSATGGDIKIYTLSGKLVKNIPVASGAADALWNMTNEAGNRINSGLYVYIMQDSEGNKKTGKIVITN
jgi:hypothetical protein